MSTSVRNQIRTYPPASIQESRHRLARKICYGGGGKIRPGWRDALAEGRRVLAPGGRFFFEEVTAAALARPFYRALFDHPTRDGFTAGEFLAERPRHGLQVGER
ncbi:hypothetical protein [Nonomuraea sp. CA-141351]|uniref:hypothetical protein n=1 Tax=Nonomuraea sp. CA-141351 TaxID=3239996 RepID=UPI003D8C5706